jgi:hypothetical protein
MGLYALFMDHGLYSAAGAQSEIMDWIRLNLLTGDEAETRLLNDGGDEQLSLHKREMVANADARTGSEGNVRVPGELLLACGREAFRIENLRLRKVFRAAMQCIGRDEKSCAFGYLIANNCCLPQRFAERIPPREIVPTGGIFLPSLTNHHIKRSRQPDLLPVQVRVEDSSGCI